MLYKCNKCGEEKPAEAFRRGAPKLVKGKPCRKCEGIRHAQWQKDNPEARKVISKKYSSSARGLEAQARYRERHRDKLRVRWREWYHAHKDRELARQRVRRTTDKEKHYAREQVAYALKTGKLVKGPCEICGTTKQVEGHHEDYSKPLDVNWLCMPDHKKWHMENK